MCMHARIRPQSVHWESDSYTHPFPFRVATVGSSFFSQGILHDTQLPCIVNLITIIMHVQTARAFLRLK